MTRPTRHPLGLATSPIVALVLWTLSAVVAVNTVAEQAPEAAPPSVLDGVVTALCPDGDFDQIRSVRFVGPTGPPGSVNSYNNLLLLAPDPSTGTRQAMRQEHRTDQGDPMLRVTYGERALVSGLGELEDGMKEELFAYAEHRLPSILWRRDTLSLEMLETETTEAGTFRRYRWVGSELGAILGIEVESGRLAYLEYYLDDGTDSGEGMLRRNYLDYREVGGCFWPFLQQSTQNGEPYQVWQLDEVLIDEELDLARFFDEGLESSP